ncbi:hypothetical protein COJ96_02120 [Bacillus sp. AFS073361]|uniref:hypothetical protein n=1 Tax=Bacillus sp. AFS073361 TaxID=2033511 RepID=UPI000BFA8DA1|nr:hypothetical protein [Bacillus sp. AFS073361]PFP30781.1 hypothetical protein COJ96_02120 [Bacillus sp. AFS073361]
MEELIKSIYKITVDLIRILNEENYQEFEKQLNDRDFLMNKVDIWRAEQPLYQYTPKEKQLLEDILRLDEQFISILKGNLDKTRTLLNQIKNKKMVSKKYHPYMKQTNGAFLDARK